MDALGKPARRMFYVIIAGLTLSITFNVWVNIEKNKLNQQYAQLIEQREKLNQKYDELNNRYKERLDQVVQLIDLWNWFYSQKLDKSKVQK